MLFRVPLKYFFAITHLSVFLVSVLFVGVSTYFITRENYARQNAIPQISEKAQAREAQEYLVYEKRDIIALRPNENHKVRKTGVALNLETSEENIIYSFTDDPFEERFSKTAPTASLLSNGKIFVNGVSSLGFVVLDQYGNNFSSEYALFRDRTMRATQVLFGREGDLFYASPGSQKSSVIVWKKEKTEKISSPLFPKDSEMLKFFGLNAGGNALYAGQEYAEPNAPAKIWKIELDKKRVIPMHSFAGAKSGSVRLCPEQNFGVFIRSAIDPTEGESGIAIAPSQIFASDLAADAASEVFSSQTLLGGLLVSCKSGLIFVKEKNKILAFDIAGKRHKLPVLRGSVLFVSEGGKQGVLRNQKKLFLVNFGSGEQHEIGDEMGYTVLGFIRQ